MAIDSSLPPGREKGWAQAMKVLLLYVHPKHDGFCGELLTEVSAELHAAGHEVEVADLYAERFNPAFDVDDYAQFSQNEMPADVRREQARIERNDVLAIVTPVWWYQYPAMLKGWIDRVFSQGWAFADSHSRSVEPLLRLRDVLILASAGGRAETYEKYHYRHGIEALWDTGIWSYCGIRPRTRFLWGVQPQTLGENARREYHVQARGWAREFVSELAGNTDFAAGRC